MAHKVKMLNLQDRRPKLNPPYPNKDSSRELPSQICSLPSRGHTITCMLPPLIIIFLKKIISKIFTLCHT